jgi:SAM-dependent methyltransferase
MALANRGGEDTLSSETEHWRARLAASRTPVWKRIVYDVIRPALDFRARSRLSSAFRDLPHLSLVLQDRGFPIETRRSWVDRHARLRGRHLLVQGTGTGWDTLTWQSFRPARITALDAFSFDDAWRDIAAYCAREHLVVPTFGVADLEMLPLETGSVDVVVSDAVYEHCRNLEAVLRETRRVLRPGGYLYAGYGPLWFTWGGDHYSGRGGNEHGFNHVSLDPAAYRNYFVGQRRPVEDTQSGGRYVELDLFSKLTTREYLAAFDRTGFDLLDLRLELSPEAVDFVERWPERARALLARHPNLAPDDLLIKANLVVLRRRG